MPNTVIKKVKKVNAFPIAAKLTVGVPVPGAPATEGIKGKVLKLNNRGFLVEAIVPAWKTGEKFNIAFELPVLHKAISEACVVVKMYVSPESQVLEGHFQSLTADGEHHIMRFLASIPKAE